MRPKILEFFQSTLISLGLNLNETLILNQLMLYFSSGVAERRTLIDGYSDEENKVPIRNDYYKIYYNKIKNDLPILRLGNQSIRKTIYSMEQKGVLKRFKEINNQSTLFIRLIDLEKICDSNAYDQFEGQDKTLANFVKGMWQLKFNSKPIIKISEYKFVYASPYIKSTIIKSNFLKFKEMFMQYLKIFLSERIYSYIKSSHLSTLNNEFIMEFDNTCKQFYVDNRIKIEQCFVLTYTNFVKIFLNPELNDALIS